VTIGARRGLAWAVSCLLVLGLWAGAETARAAGSGPQGFPNAAIADAGLRYVGQSRPTGWDQPGECIKWVQSWVREAGGRMAGGGPVSAYVNSPAIEVPAGEAVRGDVFQISKGDTYSGSPHTGVVLGPRNGDGTFDVVEGNIPQGSGRVRTHRRVLAAPAGHQLRIWRFGSVAPPGRDPIGSVDQTGGGPHGKIMLRGWSFDPDTPTIGTSVHVYIDGPAGSGAFGGVLPANHQRPDVAAAFPGAGAAHGFDGEIDVPPGNHSVHVYAINTAAGHNNPLLWSGTIHAPAAPGGSPRGSFDEVQGRVGGKALVRGWTYDPDAVSEPADVHAYIDGWAGSGARGIDLGPADRSRPDVNNAFPGVGDDHGFEKVIDGLSPGLHTIYLYAINRAGGGENPLLRVLTVNVPGPDPIGNVDLANGGASGFVQLVGWTLDPDTPEDASDIHVYIGGPAGSGARSEAVHADIQRPDVGAAFPGAGSAHGFSVAIGGVPPGPQPVFVYAINTAQNSNNPLLWSGTINVPGAAAGSPFGHFDTVDGLLSGRAQVRGWTIDGDVMSEPTDVHAYIDGPAGSGARGIDLGSAAASRPDVAAAYPGAGDRHGFDTAIDKLSSGRHVVWMYAINAGGGGENPLLAALPVTVPEGEEPAPPVPEGGEGEPGGGQAGVSKRCRAARRGVKRARERYRAAKRAYKQSPSARTRKRRAKARRSYVAARKAAAKGCRPSAA
jgi:hypothetical protein